MVLVPVLLGAVMSAAPALDAQEKKIASWIDARRAEAVDLLRRQVEVNSGTLNPQGVEKVGEILAAELRAIGFRTWWVPGVTGSGRGPHLFAEREGTRGRRVLLIGHLDTVFELDSPFQRWEPLGEGEARGPGSVDMKGGNTVIVQALQALDAAGALDGATVRVAFTGDEEDPGPLPASRAALREIAGRCDVALAFEATAEGLDTATVGRRGATGWRLRTRGVAGHSSAVFGEEYGSGAIFEAARVLSAFHARLPERNLTFNPGLVLGGGDVAVDPEAVKGTASGKTNIIADEAVVVGDLRFLTAEQEARAHERMREIVAAGNLPRTSAEIEFMAGYPAMEPKPGNYALLDVLDAVSRALELGPVGALDPARRGAGDVSFVADLVDSLDGLGASGPGSHTPQETIDLAALPAITKRAALLIYRLTR
jgi:glutamate carboxypeptidase